MKNQKETKSADKLTTRSKEEMGKVTTSARSADTSSKASDNKSDNRKETTRKDEDKKTTASKAK